MNVENKRVLIVGMARSGIAAVKLLLRHGAVPLLSDKQTIDAFGHDLDAFLHTPSELHLGEDPVSLLPKCDLVVISPGVPLDSAIVTQAKAQRVPLIGELELAYSFLQGRLIAVTGTNGKTTTVTLLGELFKDAGYTVHIGGNIGYPLSSIALESQPDDIVIIEVSSFQLETIQSFHPHCAALLNITEDHLNRHGTMDAYTALKKRIFENQNKEDLAVVNQDDPLVVALTGKLQSQIIWFSRKAKVLNGICLQNNTLVSVSCGKQTPICSIDDIRIPGPHNLENAMAAAAVGIANNISPTTIKQTLRTFAGVEHRIEIVRIVNGVTYINDSKGTNAASTIKAVQSMKAPTVIILGGYNKHTDFDSLTEIISQSSMIQHAILIGETAQQIANSLSKNGFIAFTYADSLEDAVHKATDQSENGGNILLSPACASFDMFRDYEHRGAAYKEIVHQLQSSDL